ncbi:hypothetical protein EON67_00470 [archaeon]|nr:MAG: hypothetical protein EON67_00470 [archaeon]
MHIHACCAVCAGANAEAVNSRPAADLFAPHPAPAKRGRRAVATSSARVPTGSRGADAAGAVPTSSSLRASVSGGGAAGAHRAWGAAPSPLARGRATGGVIALDADSDSGADSDSSSLDAMLEAASQPIDFEASLRSSAAAAPPPLPTVGMKRGRSGGPVVRLPPSLAPAHALPAGRMSTRTPYGAGAASSGSRQAAGDEYVQLRTRCAPRVQHASNHPLACVQPRVLQPGVGENDPDFKGDCPNQRAAGGDAARGAA